MKTQTRILTVIFALLPYLLISQWQWQNPYPKTLNNIRAICAPDEDHVYSAEFLGNIIYSSDGGQTWELNLEVTDLIYDMWFLNANTGYLVGSGGKVLTTIDGAESWSEIDLGTENTLYDIFFCDDSHGWITSDTGSIFRTNDGGLNWESIETGMMEYIRKCFFINQYIGYCVLRYDNTLFKTADGGISWEACQTPMDSDIEDLWFFSDDSGFISYFDTVYKTVDGGTSWNVVDFDIPIGIHPSMQFINADTGWVVTDSSVFITLNGGENWENLSATFGAGCFQFANFNTGWSFSDKQIFKTGNHGISWLSQTQSVTRSAILKIWFIDALRGWAVSSDGLLKTLDGGNTWFIHDSLISHSLCDICFIDENNGWCCGGYGDLFRTQDGGESWQEVNITDISLAAIQFINQNTGWLVGWSHENGCIYKTSDGGDTWELQYTSDSIGFSSISMLSELQGWIGGNKKTAPEGVLIKTEDGGDTWQQLSVELNPGCKAIKLVNDSIGFALTSSYSAGFYKTQDGGITWEVYYLGQITGLHTIGHYLCFFNELQGFVVGTYFGWKGFILYTMDGGTTWEYQKSGTMNAPYDIFYLDNEHIWLSGSDGSILFTDNLGGASSSIEDYTCINNEKLKVYPNPSYSDFTLEYNLSFPCDVHLLIYNQLGQKIKIIANKNQQQGTQQLKVDLSGLPGGIYFCVLQKEKEVLSKRIIKW